MSGGSFGYLCHKDLSDLIYSGFGEHWDDMLAELDELCPEAAANMRKIMKDTRQFEQDNEYDWSQLKNVLHAIEWWRSNDWGKDQVDEVIANYRSKLTNES